MAKEAKTKKAKEEEKEYKLSDLPGIGAAAVAKLEAAGIYDLMGLAVSSPPSLSETAGIGEAAARKAIQAARKMLNLGFQDGLEFEEFDQWGHDMDNSSFLMGDFLVNDNVINAIFDGIFFDELDNHGQFLYNGSTVVMGDTEFSGNQITAGFDGHL